MSNEQWTGIATLLTVIGGAISWLFTKYSKKAKVKDKLETFDLVNDYLHEAINTLQKEIEEQSKVINDLKGQLLELKSELFNKDLEIRKLQAKIKDSNEQ